MQWLLGIFLLRLTLVIVYNSIYSINSFNDFNFFLIQCRVLFDNRGPRFHIEGPWTCSSVCLNTVTICFKFYCSSCSQRLKFVQIIFCLTNRKNKVFDNILRIKFASFLTFHAYRLPKFEGKLLCYKVRLANLSWSSEFYLSTISNQRST